MPRGIVAFGGYQPTARLNRQEIAKTHAWFNPALKALAKGERSMANWDEDSVTMAVEAARDCLTDHDRSTVSGIYMASTSFPFRDRQNAGIVADALKLNRAIASLDIASSQRAGTSALLTAFATSQDGDQVLVTASEKRRTKAASPLEMTSGDGAAALLTGNDNLVAKFIDGHTETVDFVDHFRGDGDHFDYGWEDRWVRDEGYLKVVPDSINALLAKTGIDASRINTFCFPATNPRISQAIAKSVGLSQDTILDNLMQTCGNTGSAHALVLLVHALEQARAGDIILVASFGQGSDALLLEVTDGIDNYKTHLGISGHLKRRREETRYSRFLAFNDLLTMERGIRAEVDKQTGLSTHYRNKDMAQGMIGGRCSECDTSQFPKSRICVSCGAIDAQDNEPFSDKAAKLNSYTADNLTYTPDPPTYFGMVEFDEGGRLMSDFTDVVEGTLEVGMRLRMVFRVKDYDSQRGFRRYFWKATPADPS